MNDEKLELIYKVIQGELPQRLVSKKDLHEFELLLMETIRAKKDKKYLPWLH